MRLAYLLIWRGFRGPCSHRTPWTQNPCCVRRGVRRGVRPFFFPETPEDRRALGIPAIELSAHKGAPVRDDLQHRREAATWTAAELQSDCADGTPSVPICKWDPGKIPKLI